MTVVVVLVWLVWLAGFDYLGFLETFWGSGTGWNYPRENCRIGSYIYKSCGSVDLWTPLIYESTALWTPKICGPMSIWTPILWPFGCMNPKVMALWAYEPKICGPQTYEPQILDLKSGNKAPFPLRPPGSPQWKFVLLNFKDNNFWQCYFDAFWSLVMGQAWQ